MNKIAKGFADFLGVKVSDVEISNLDKKAITKGDEILGEIQPEVLIRGFVDEIDGDIVYFTGDDGEPFCTMLNLCKKVHN